MTTVEPPKVTLTNGAAARTDASAPTNAPRLVTLEAIMVEAVDRAERRAHEKEKPIPLPWPTLAEHFGGGLWPGVHFLNAGTGIGKSALALQIATHAARQGFPAAYIGLELEAMQVALRVLGDVSRVPWSKLYTGKSGPEHFRRVREAMPSLEGLPLHFQFARPQGYPASELGRVAEELRALYPEKDGPGSRPCLVVLDFLQIIGDEQYESRDLRERIGRAAYFARDVASRLNMPVLAISSVAREKYVLEASKCGVDYDTDDNGRPVERRLRNPDLLVGTGKESGEIEFSGDSVSMLMRVPETYDGHGVDVVFATAKARATRATWSPLHFTGFGYEEPEDGGARMVDAWKNATTARETAREEKKTAKEQVKLTKIDADAMAIVRYVLAHPDCKVTQARINAVADSSVRWTKGVDRLGPALVQTKVGKVVGCRVDVARLPDGWTPTMDVDAPPHPPPPSTSTVDGPAALPRTKDNDGQSTMSIVSTTDAHSRNGVGS